MTERAAHLVDAVLAWVPVRQWVLTVPYRLRYRMAFDHGLSRAVLGRATLSSTPARCARRSAAAGTPAQGAASRGLRQAQLEGFDLHANVCGRKRTS
jgi:hypothetical protein